tara:strand:+ start:116 stop:283 length:168 start_codon:yes stop_codon:yes gene_type:complete
MKYFIIKSNKQTLGIWGRDIDLDELVNHCFIGHEGITYTEITKKQYYKRNLTANY